MPSVTCAPPGEYMYTCNTRQALPHRYLIITLSLLHLREEVFDFSFISFVLSMYYEYYVLCTLLAPNKYIGIGLTSNYHSRSTKLNRVP